MDNACLWQKNWISFFYFPIFGYCRWQGWCFWHLALGSFCAQSTNLLCTFRTSPGSFALNTSTTPKVVGLINGASGLLFFMSYATRPLKIVWDHGTTTNPRGSYDIEEPPKRRLWWLRGAPPKTGQFSERWLGNACCFWSWCQISNCAGFNCIVNRIYRPTQAHQLAFRKQNFTVQNMAWRIRSLCRGGSRGWDPNSPKFEETFLPISHKLRNCFLFSWTLHEEDWWSGPGNGALLKDWTFIFWVECFPD